MAWRTPVRRGGQRGRTRTAAAVSLFVALTAVLALTLVLGSAGVAAAPVTLYVNAVTGNDQGATNPCTDPASPCATIGQAVGQAASGDVIALAAGTYHEAVSTSLNLTFTGAGQTGPGATVIDSTGKTQPGLTLLGTDTVSNLAMVDNDSGIPGALNVNTGGNATVQDVTITTAGASAGSDGIAMSGTSLTVTGATITATNNDASIANTSNSSTSLVVNDGSGIEITGGRTQISDSRIMAVEGIALRIRPGAVATTAIDSVIESSGVEDIQSGQPGYVHDIWQAIELGAGTLGLTGDTVYNATVGAVTPSVSDQPASDALWSAPTAGATATIVNTILRAQPAGGPPSSGGADIDANENVTASDSSYTTTNVVGSGTTITPAYANGNIPGDPGFADAPSDLSLAAGSALVGAGDITKVTTGEVDLAGNARSLVCDPASTGVSGVVDIGAFESGQPQCPAPVSSGDSIGAIAQPGGAGNCITGDSAAGSGCDTTGVPGLTGGTPTDIAQSADGKFVYTATEDTQGTGVDIAEFARSSTGVLSQLPVPDNCVSPSTSAQSGCGTANDAALDYFPDGFTGQPTVVPARIALSPDGTSLYVDTGLEIAELGRDTTTGALTQQPAADCISFQTTANGSPCAYNGQEQVEPAAALVVSPDSKSVYLATLNDCTHAGSPAPRPSVAVASLAGPASAGDGQNADCNITPNHQFGANTDVALFSRDATTGVLTPVQCYSSGVTGVVGCQSSDYDGLYSMTSLAVSSDGADVYVTSAGPQLGGVADAQVGQVTTLVRDPSTGELTPASGTADCVTAAAQPCGATGGGTADVPGLIDPQQIVISPDGKQAYVASAQYFAPFTPLGGVDTGTLVASDIVTLARNASTGALTPLAGATCFTGYHEGCSSTVGPQGATVQVPALSGEEGLTITPDGDNVYASAAAPNVDSGVVAFSRDPATGFLTALSSPATCLANGTPAGAMGLFACSGTTVAGLSNAVTDLPGGIVSSPDCASAYVMSDGITELSRAQPAGVDCPGPGGGGGSGGGGKPSQAVATLSTTGLNFGTGSLPTAVGSTSPAQTVTVTDTGLASLTVTTVSISANAALQAAPSADAASPFVLADSCHGQTIAPQASCTISVSFRPTVAGVVGATLSIADNATDSPQRLNLTGVGGIAEPQLSATTLSFGTTADQVATGAQSAAQTFTMKDAGQEPLTFNGLVIVGAQASAFQVTHDGCSGVTLQPNLNGSCAVSVAVTPPGPGNFSATLSIPDNAPDNPQSIALQAIASVPSMTVAPTSLHWADGEAFVTKTVTMTNTGKAMITFGRSTFTTPGPFGLSGGTTCDGSVIAPAETCAVAVAFSPTRAGTYDADLALADDAPGSPQLVALTGTVTGGNIAGTVSGPRGPMPGVAIDACTISNSGCVGTTSGPGGAYEFSNLLAGNWRGCELSPPSGLDAAAAIVVVKPGQTATQNFVLHAPVPLSPRLSISGNGGTQSSGVPFVNWEQPFAINAQETIPPTGPPNSTQIFYFVSGIGDDSGTASGTSFNQAGVIAFGVRYDASGTATGMTDPLTAELDCQPTDTDSAPCNSIIPDPEADGEVPPVGASAARFTPTTHVPTAHAAVDCPQALPVGFNIVPDLTYGGVDFVYVESDGTQHTFILGQAQIAPLSPSGNPFKDAVLNVGRIGVNFALNFNPYIGAYNAFIQAVQSLTISAHSNSMQLQGLENGNAILQLAVASLNAQTHGAAYWVGQVFSGIFSYSANYENGLKVMVKPDCPPKHADLYVDPSGTVQTTAKAPVYGAKVVLKRSATATGKLANVPSGSVVMSPANRRNPDKTTITGSFGWDVLPGFYDITATHSGCTAATKKKPRQAATGVLAVPPERSGLTLTLRCPHLRRAATSLALTARAGPAGMHVLQATVSAKGRHVSVSELAGNVAFTANGKPIGGVGVDIAHGSATATLDLPATATAISSFGATYAGNGLYGPSSIRAKPGAGAARATGTGKAKGRSKVRHKG